MKRLIISLAALFVAAISFAQPLDSALLKRLPVQITAKVPEALKFLPAPPVNGSPEFLTDSVFYFKDKALRDTERGEVAIEDAKVSVEYYMKRFGKPMEIRMTQEDFPAVADYIKTTYIISRAGIQSAKEAYARMRPYQYFCEPSLIPESEFPNDLTSYPSGHTIRAWAVALALTAIDPDHQEAILKTGIEMGESRVIAGYHFKSDVDAARLLASATFASLVADPVYLDLMARARAELSAARSRNY